MLADPVRRLIIRVDRFKRVNHRFQVPVNALILQCAIPAVLGLIYLGSNVIFFAFFQLTTIGYLVSYFIPILLVFRESRSFCWPKLA